MRAAFSAVFLFLGLHCGGTSVPALGAINPEHVCNDVKRCDARGDVARSMLRDARTPLMLAEKQGPENFLGKVAPNRNARSVLKTCGGDVGRDDWLESGPNVRVLELSTEGKQSLREAIKTHLARELLAHPGLLIGQEANLESIVDGAASAAAVKRLSMVSQAYWLTDSAFERRLAQCGEEEHENLIYSLTLVSLSEMSRKELEAKLYGALAAKLAPAATSGAAPEAREADAANDGVGDPSASEAAEAPPLEPPEALRDPVANQRMALQERAFSAVRSLANELRFIAAFGFDEK